MSSAAYCVCDISISTKYFLPIQICHLYPQRRNFCTRSEYLTMTNSVFNLNVLALVVQYQEGPKFTLGGPTPPGRPLADNFLPKASTSQYLIVIFISTFQLQQFPRFQGVPNLRQEALCPLYAFQRKNVCTRGEYFTMSNSTFNFNFLSLVFSEILGGTQMYTRGSYAPCTPPSGEIFYPKRVLHNI